MKPESLLETFAGRIVPALRPVRTVTVDVSRCQASSGVVRRASSQRGETPHRRHKQAPAALCGVGRA